MPTSLRALCIALAVLLTFHACLSPFIEDGLDFLFPLAIDSALLWLVLAFSKRQPNTKEMLSAYCVMAPFLYLLFFPFVDEYGQFSWLVRAQFVSEFIVCVALFLVLRRPTTTTWFAGDKSNCIEADAA